MATVNDVILLLGDNLADFTSAFDKKTLVEREKNTNTLVDAFGKKFIVIPNPVYGDWESANNKYTYSLSPAQKDSVIKSLLKGY